MTKISTVLFDWGGVIADDPGDDFLTKVLKDVGATDEQVGEIFSKYMKQFMRGEITETEYWRAVHDNYGLTIPGDISEQFMKWSGLVANEAVLNLVKELKSKGTPVALLTNVIEPTYNVLEKAGYYSLFDEIIASCKVGYAKPDIEIYEYTLEKLGVRPEEILFIDDKARNLGPAKELGMVTILAVNSKQIIEDIYELTEL